MKMFTAWILLVSLTGCSDKAAPAYARCVQLDVKGDIGGSWEACNVAVADNPTSESGKAAAMKLTEMKPRYDAWKIEQDRKAAIETEVAATRTAKKVAAQARVQAAHDAELRDKISRSLVPIAKSWCAGQGLPPRLFSYTGGTWEENAAVASADGCRQGPSPGWFCCP